MGEYGQEKMEKGATLKSSKLLNNSETFRMAPKLNFRSFEGERDRLLQRVIYKEEISHLS